MIFIRCIAGGFVPTLDMHHVWLLLVFGIVAYLIPKLGYSLATMVFTIALCPLADRALRQSF
jgi:putative tricarboxylic transport membrane protein